MEPYLALAEQNQKKAHDIIRRIGVIEAWRSIGAEPRLVGSLSMGLLVKHRDIDLHIYSSPLNPAASFQAMGQIAAHPTIRRVEYTSLMHTEEACLEWHAWYEDEDGKLWQIDMIHLLKGSRYDGYFERMAQRITAALTPESRQAILHLKYETPDDTKIPGIAYYQAVLRDGVRSYAEFTMWLRAHPIEGIIEWMP